MIHLSFTDLQSPVHRRDPRVRVLAAAALSLTLAMVTPFPALLTGLAVCVCLAFLARLPLCPLTRRLAHLNAFMVLVLVLVPLAGEGAPLFTLGPLVYGRDSFETALAVVVKANGIMLALTALVATMETARFGIALDRLRAPRRLVDLFLFTVRYVHVLDQERAALLRAMRARGFRVRPTVHGLRSVGYLVGMLLVRAFDRSERIWNAMKCRGYSHAPRDRRGGPPLARADYLFAALVGAAVAAMVVLAC